MPDQLPTPIGDAVARGDGMDVLLKTTDGKDTTLETELRKGPWTWRAAVQWTRDQTWSAWTSLSRRFGP